MSGGSWRKSLGGRRWWPRSRVLRRHSSASAHGAPSRSSLGAQVVVAQRRDLNVIGILALRDVLPHKACGDQPLACLLDFVGVEVELVLLLNLELDREGALLLHVAQDH